MVCVRVHPPLRSYANTDRSLCRRQLPCARGGGGYCRCPTRMGRRGVVSSVGGGGFGLGAGRVAMALHLLPTYYLTYYLGTYLCPRVFGEFFAALPDVGSLTKDEAVRE